MGSSCTARLLPKSYGFRQYTPRDLASLRLREEKIFWATCEKLPSGQAGQGQPQDQRSAMAAGQLAACLPAWLASRLHGRLAGLLADWLTAWLPGWLAACLPGWLASWVVS